MNQKTKTVYYCDHCKKHGLSSPRMHYHEKVCHKNPENARPCFGCHYLQKKEAQLSGDYYNGGEWSRPVSVFFCKAKNVFLHTPKNEIKGNAYDFAHENDPMPKQCDQFDAVSFDGSNLRFVEDDNLFN